jgi:CheY-like chemotaxis protein
MSEEKNQRNSLPINLPEVMERIGGDEAFLQELIDIYIEDFVEKYAKLKKAIESRDFQAIKVIGHSLRGSSGNLSLNGLLDTSTDMEQSGKEQDIEKAKLLFIKLNMEFERLKDFLPSGKRQAIDLKWKGINGETKTVQTLDDQSMNGSEITILAADDSVPNQVLIKYYANLAGFQIDIARNGKEAVDLFRKKDYSIVFLDIHMPEVDGFEALNRMRQIEIENILPETPIIALTGSTFQEKGTTCLEAGFNDFVEKSAIQENLVPIVQKYVQSTIIKRDKTPIDKSILALVPGYLENRKEDVQRIRFALEKQNFGTIEDLGHKMKGSGKCYGFATISMLGHRIEISAKKKNPAEIAESVDQMQAYLSTLQIK